MDGVASSATHTFTPAKRWKLFFCPKVHNDVGYTDLQPHVNELDTRNTDTILSILSKFPFYKFNFETSWLVENFLDCRIEEVRDEFFRRAHEGTGVDQRILSECSDRHLSPAKSFIVRCTTPISCIASTEPILTLRA